MTDQMKLTYFNGRGRVEFIRQILALRGVQYEDNRVEYEDWPAFKPTTTWGHMPILEANGETISESVAIGRYLARKNKLAGETAWEEARIDEIIDAFRDLAPNMKSDDFVDNHAKPFFTKLTELKKKNGGKWFVGQNVTWVDIYVANGVEMLKTSYPSVLADFPAVAEVQENVFALEQIKKWINARPVTPW